MTKITYVSRKPAVETEATRVAKIADTIIDNSVFVPAGRVEGLRNYCARTDTIEVRQLFSNGLGLNVGDEVAVLTAIRDNPRVAPNKKKIQVEGAANWMSHILYHGHDDRSHEIRADYRNRLVRAVIY